MELTVVTTDRGPALSVAGRILHPTKIVCIGLNYRSHAAEMKATPPAEPLLFLKAPSALLGHGDPIVLPAESRRVDYEGELAVVIGKTVRRVQPSDAASVVLGLTCFNDVTARDLQKRDGQYSRAKSFDTFAPTGPVLVPWQDPANLSLETRVNGEVRQRAGLSDLIFSVERVIAHASAAMTLYPGDIVATGTPGGIGALQVGDTVEIEIPGIGVLRNSVHPE